MQVRVPGGGLHGVVQETTDPSTQSKPSSAPFMQLLSMPSQISGGCGHEGYVHVTLLHVRVLATLHAPWLYVHDSGVPATHAKPLSAPNTQSSSRPLHTSLG
jgi:hypothetical protein